MEKIKSVGLEARASHQPNKLSGGDNNVSRSPALLSTNRPSFLPMSLQEIWTQKPRRDIKIRKNSSKRQNRDYGDHEENG